MMVGKMELADIFRRAAAAAEAADPGEPDGGTCNMDTPAFTIDRVRSSTIEAAAEAAGVPVTEFKWFGGKRWWWLRVPLRGQGNRRTTMMEAAQRVLDEAAKSVPGMRACGYCQMD